MAHFTVPAHIVAGKGSLEEAAPFFMECGQKALIVTGPHIGRSPMMAKLVKLLTDCSISYAVYDRVTGEPTDRMVEEGRRLYREENCQFCIGIGGGSPLDTAKAVAAMSGKEGSISDYCGRPITGDIPPVAAVPTTSGTGSEATRFTVITDSRSDVKMLLQGERLLPYLAVVDPGFGMDMPKSVTAATGLDALTHAVEAYTSKKAQKLTDILAISAVRRIMKYLPKAYRNGRDGKAREEMSMAALEAGICINNSSVTLVHGMSRPVGALFHVPHGMSNAMLLGECLAFALDGAYERFAELGCAAGAADPSEGTGEAAHKFLDSIKELCRICEIPAVEEYGIEKEKFLEAIPKMAADAIASGSPSNTRKTVTCEDCEEIYKKIIGER